MLDEEKTWPFRESRRKNTFFTPAAWASITAAFLTASTPSAASSVCKPIDLAQEFLIGPVPG